MKKVGIIVFIFAILVGVLFANLFSFGRASGDIFTFSFGRGIKGSGVEASDVRKIEGFTGIDVGGVFHVEVTAGKEFQVEVQADDNLLQFVQTEVEGNVLKISTSERVKSHTRIKVLVSAPNIESVEASGASKVFVTGVKASDFRVNTSGASQTTLAGETSTIDVEVSGASSVDAEKMSAVTGKVDASGASRVTVLVTDRLSSHASGASKIAYLGNPGSVDKSSSGASKIYQK